MIPSMPALGLVLAVIDPTAQGVLTSGRNLPLARDAVARHDPKTPGPGSRHTH